MRNKKGQFIKGLYVGFGFKKGSKPWNKNKKGIHLSPKSEFKKGFTPWNKGVKGAQLAWNKGLLGTHFSKKTEFKNGDNKGEQNYKWKGDGVGYWGLHSWVQRTLGKARKCNNRQKKFLPFLCSNYSKTYHWANRSRLYKRNVKDWTSLCISCHLKADRRKIKLC